MNAFQWVVYRKHSDQVGFQVILDHTRTRANPTHSAQQDQLIQQSTVAIQANSYLKKPNGRQAPVKRQEIITRSKNKDQTKQPIQQSTLTQESKPFSKKASVRQAPVKYKYKQEIISDFIPTQSKQKYKQSKQTVAVQPQPFSKKSIVRQLPIKQKQARLNLLQPKKQIACKINEQHRLETLFEIAQIRQPAEYTGIRENDHQCFVEAFNTLSKGEQLMAFMRRPKLQLGKFRGKKYGDMRECLLELKGEGLYGSNPLVRSFAATKHRVDLYVLYIIKQLVKVGLFDEFILLAGQP